MSIPFPIVVVAGLLLCPGGDGPAAPTAAATPAAATPTAAAPDDASPVVLIDGQPITRGEYKAFLFNYFRGDVIEPMINEKLIERAAKRENIQVTDKDLEAWIEERIKETGAMAELQGIDPAELRQKYRRVGLTYVITERLIKRRRLTDEGLQREYNLRYGEKRRARHILIGVNGDNPHGAPGGTDDATAKKKAAEIHEKLKNGADFAEVAREESSDIESGRRGGELPEFSREDMVPEFADVAFKLKENDLSEPVRSDFGYHIIQVTKIIPPGKALDDKLKAELRGEVEKRPVDREEHQRFLDEIRKGVKIEKKVE